MPAMLEDAYSTRLIKFLMLASSEADEISVPESQKSETAKEVYGFQPFPA